MTPRGREPIGSTAILRNPIYDDTLQDDCCANEKAAAEQRSERQFSEIPAKILRPGIRSLVRDRVAPLRVACRRLNLADSPRDRGVAPSVGRVRRGIVRMVARMSQEKF